MILDAIDRLVEIFDTAQNGGKYHQYASKVNDAYDGQDIPLDFADILDALPDQMGVLPAVFIEEVRTSSENINFNDKQERHEVDVHILVQHADLSTLRQILRKTIRAAEMTIENEARKQGDIDIYFVDEKIYSPSFEDGGIYVAGGRLRVVALENMEVQSA